MRHVHRLPVGIRLLNTLVPPLIHGGVKLGPLVLLTVPGRKSGVPHTTPVALGEGDGQRWLVANFGNVDWVRNLRAAGTATLTRGRRAEEIVVVELSPALAAPFLRQSLAASPPFIRKHFGVTPASSLEDFAREVAHHPVFQIIGSDEAAATSAR